MTEQLHPLNQEEKPVVSIVIVCMNNLKNLYPCLESIRKYTHVSYECFVVAYLFSKENLEKVKHDFPWVKFIESNEIRGFSENNNLALRQAKGKYCFVQNDDTELRMPCIDKLVETIEKLPDKVALVSPKGLLGNGEIQYCGRAEHSRWHYFLGAFGLWSEKRANKRNPTHGIFKSYDIIGAYFLIKTNLFQEIGWFDERYFFTPEDLAVSVELRKHGYECWVDADAEIVHYEGMTGKSMSPMQTATGPAGFVGAMMWRGGNNYLGYSLFTLLNLPYLCGQFIYHTLRANHHGKPNRYNMLAWKERNTLSVCFTRKTPKQVFIKFYEKLKS
jgi:GT2 family glycosyltransferase